MVEFWQLIFTQSPMELRIMFAVFMAALLWEIFKKAWALTRRYTCRQSKALQLLVWGQVSMDLYRWDTRILTTAPGSWAMIITDPRSSEEGDAWVVTWPSNKLDKTSRIIYDGDIMTNMKQELKKIYDELMELYNKPSMALLFQPTNLRVLRRLITKLVLLEKEDEKN